MTVVTADLRDAYVAALLAGDAIHARHLVDRAVDGGVPIPAVYLRVLAPALEQVGQSWEDGSLGIAYEHRATAITQGILGALGPRMRVAPTTGRLAVLACTEGELHGLGLQMVGDFLESAGWEVILLGPSVPAAALAGLVADESPDVVGLSTATPGLVEGLGHAVEALAAVDPRPCVVAGGRAWQHVRGERAIELGADLCLPGPAELVATLSERFPPVLD